MVSITPSFPPSVFQATLAYVRAQPPFCVDSRSVHRTSHYDGVLAGDIHPAVIWAQRDRAEAYFDLSPEDSSRNARNIFEGFRQLKRGLYPGALAVPEGSHYIGYHLFTWNSLPGGGWIDLSLDYVYVNPEHRGRGLRDLMQTCLLGAALLHGMIEGQDIRLLFRQVKNPNEAERYLQAGFEDFYEPVTRHDEDEGESPFSCYAPNISHLPQPPPSYQRRYAHASLRARLEGLGLLNP